MSVRYIIQVRRDIASNWELRNPVLADGEIGFDTTNSILKIGNGTSPWLSLLTLNPPGQSNNYIVNGAFDFWQRGPSIAILGYNADRWYAAVSVGQGIVVSQQAFTPGTAPVAGYEGASFARIAWSGTPAQTYWYSQRIEDVRTLADQTVTLSFWAKATSNTSALTPMIEQNFGSGGSGVVARNGTPINLTTSWQRFSQTFIVPSVSGKTIGANSYLDVRPFNGSTSVDGNSLDIWGVQLEVGSVATPFKRNAPSIQAELAACQRYYYRQTNSAAGLTFGVNIANNATSAGVYVHFPVTMRVPPTALEQTGTAANYAVRFGTTTTACSTVPARGSATTASIGHATFTVASGLGGGQAGRSLSNAAEAFLGWSAEL